MVEMRPYKSDRLSTFRTMHLFEHYGEFSDENEYKYYHYLANQKGLDIFILGNGSNTLFVRRKIKTLVLRNKIKEEIKHVSGDIFEITSSTQIMRVLKYFERRGRNCFYFLASVPATVGGALAMNAGGGAGPTIFDFVNSITYLDGGERITIKPEDAAPSHRYTIFSGIQDKLIIKATFVFPKKAIMESEIRKRAHWARDNQDLGYPNCGSVFKFYHKPILTNIRRLTTGAIHYPGFRTQLSRRVNNWIITQSTQSWPIVFLIRLIQMVHWICGKRAETEIIEVR